MSLNVKTPGLTGVHSAYKHRLSAAGILARGENTMLRSHLSRRITAAHSPISMLIVTRNVKYAACGRRENEVRVKLKACIINVAILSSKGDAES